MRTTEEIKKERIGRDIRTDDYIVELLLDMRELLIKQNIDQGNHAVGGGNGN